MELMHESWISIMFMPYKFFLETIQWKVDLEGEKKAQLDEETNKIKGHRTPKNFIRRS